MIDRCNEWDIDEQEEEKLFDEHRKTILCLICKSTPHTARGVPIRTYAIKPGGNDQCICIGCNAFA